MPLQNIALCFTEENIIKSMLPLEWPSPSVRGRSRLRRRLRLRRLFWKEVMASVLKYSSIILFFLGYRKGEYPHYSLISCGLTYLIFWATTRYSARTKVNLKRLKDHHLLGAPFVVLHVGLFAVLLAVHFNSYLLTLSVLFTLFLFFLINIILFLARYTQNLFRCVPSTINSVEMHAFSLMFFMAFIFIYIHNGFYVWHYLIVKQELYLPKNFPFYSTIENLLGAPPDTFLYSELFDQGCLLVLDWMDHYL